MSSTNSARRAAYNFMHLSYAVDLPLSMHTLPMRWSGPIGTLDAIRRLEWAIYVAKSRMSGVGVVRDGRYLEATDPGAEEDGRPLGSTMNPSCDSRRRAYGLIPTPKGPRRRKVEPVFGKRSSNKVPGMRCDR